MKALLSQFKGGGPSRGDMMSAAGPGSQKMKADSAGADDSSFIGLMKGFLGMGMNGKPAGAASGEGADSPKANNGAETSVSRDSIPGMASEIAGKGKAKGRAFTDANNEVKKSSDGSSTSRLSSKLTGNNNAGEAALTEGSKTWNGTRGSGIPNEASGINNDGAPARNSAEGEAKNKTNSMPAAEKLSARPALRTVENANASGAARSKADGLAREETMNIDGKSGKGTANLPGEVNKANAGVNINPTEAAAAKDPQQLKTKTEGEAPGDGTNKWQKTGIGARRGQSGKGAANSMSAQPAAGRTQGDRVPAPEIDTSSTEGKGQAALNRRTASGIQAEKVLGQSAGQKSEIVNESKKNPAVTADVLKKSEQEQLKNLKIKVENGRAPETAARRPAAQASPSAPALGQNGSSALRETDFNIKNLAPGKMVSSEASGTIEPEMDASSPKDAGLSPEKSFKEMHLNEFNSTRLNDTAGRKKFGNHLSRLGRQQASGQTRETGRQNTQWKHHRVVMKDGKALNIAARSAEGVLQLQLNAGSGELGRVLHQHLQDIKQHIQQELNIKVDLQLQDFSGGQPEQQQETGASQTPKKSSSGSGQTSAAGTSETASGIERVRYLGFNNNEWIA